MVEAIVKTVAAVEIAWEALLYQIAAIVVAIAVAAVAVAAVAVVAAEAPVVRPNFKAMSQLKKSHRLLLHTGTL